MSAEGGNMIGVAPKVEWQRQRGKILTHLQWKGMDNWGSNGRVFFKIEKNYNMLMYQCALYLMNHSKVKFGFAVEKTKKNLLCDSLE